MPLSKITLGLCLLLTAGTLAAGSLTAATPAAERPSSGLPAATPAGAPQPATAAGSRLLSDTLHWGTGPYRLDRGFGAEVLMTVSFEKAVSEGTAYFPLPVYYFDLTNHPSGASDRPDAQRPSAPAACEWDTLAFRPATPWESRLIRPYDALIGPDFVLRYSPAEFRGTLYPAGSIFPIRRNHATGAYELLTSFRLRATETATATDTDTTANTASSTIGSPAKNSRTASMLSYGPTLRVSVETSGVYRITYADLQREGLLQGAVPSDRIALYGNRAGMLPTLNTADIYDDLTDLPIAMYDGGDGQFDPGDYFLFYGQSPVTWQYTPTASATQPAFTHRQHSYSDRTYYFVGLNHPQAAARITDAPRQNIAEGETELTSFPDYLCYEKDLYNIVSGGQAWYGESFNSSGETISIPLTLTDLSDEPLYTTANGNTANVQLRAAASGMTSSGRGRLTVRAGSSNGEIDLPSTSGATSRASGLFTDTFRHTGADLPVSLTYRKSGNAMLSYLDYIEINYQRQLRLNRGELLFRHPAAIGTAVNFRIANVSAATQVWDVTDPYRVRRLPAETGGTSLRLRAGGEDSLQTFLAFDGSVTRSPAFNGLTAAQNLHGLPQTDYIVVTPTEFLAQAEEIARLHRERDGYRTAVATTEQVYNEFGTGTPDPSAIRLFAKMFYDRATQETDRPKYLLLFGNASYDVKNKLGTRTNLIPTFEVPKAYSDESPATDDGFAYLGPNEGLGSQQDGDYFSYTGIIDIAVGRLPVKTAEEADIAVQKIANYSNPYYQRLADWEQKAGNFGDWRQEITFVTDDDFESVYEYTLDFSKDVAIADPNFNLEKIYADSYIKRSDAVNAAYPEAQAALRRRMNRGAFFVGYIGHSGWDAWGDEKYLTLNDIHQWEPILSYPMMFSSSCTFAYYDQPDKTSGAEEAVLHPDGGAISMIASTRSASVGTIEYVQHDFLIGSLDRRQGQHPTIGDAFMTCKINNRTRSGTGIFILLGDPGLKTALPRYNVRTLTLNGKPVTETIDTLKAFSHITITGQIEDNGQRVTDFNGRVQIKIFDKANHLKTLGNAQSRGGFNQVVEYELQNNQLYRGSAEVKDGLFSFSFFVPKDIAYYYGPGKISYYAYSDSNGDAGGAFTDLIVGGFNTDIEPDTTAPTVKLYINKTNFLPGADGGTSPVLYAEISDRYGLNTTGVGIGHDMTLVIDGDYKNAIVVNDLFAYNTGSYTDGTLTYPLSLPAGEHTIELKAWNIFNISGTGTLNFGVNASDRFKVTALRATPNPSPKDGEVSFYFTHNGVGGIDRYELQVYDLYGRKVAQFEGRESSSYGYSVGPLTWPTGTADLQKGVYVVRVVAYNRAGEKSHKETKWVLM